MAVYPDDAGLRDRFLAERPGQSARREIRAPRKSIPHCSSKGRTKESLFDPLLLSPSAKSDNICEPNSRSCGLGAIFRRRPVHPVACFFILLRQSGYDPRRRCRRSQFGNWDFDDWLVCWTMAAAICLRLRLISFKTSIVSLISNTTSRARAEAGTIRSPREGCPGKETVRWSRVNNNQKALDLL